MIRFNAVGKTDVGLKRSNNEDAFLVRPEFGFCLVADGMGGAAAGEIASRIFSNAALEVFSKKPAATLDDTLLKIQHVFRLANERIHAHVVNYPSHEGMGCTAELLTVSDANFVIGHIGDSRTYRFANGCLKQLTRDHSLVQEQIDQGLITPSEARRHTGKNIISRAVGVEEDLALDIVSGKTVPGDVFLLCSDGLTDMISDDIISRAVSPVSPAPDRTARLVDLAKNAGGLDNITVVIAETL